MLQLAFIFGVQLLGATACQAAGIRAIWLAQALGFAIGLALAVVLAIPVLLAGAFTVPVMAGVLVVAWLALGWRARPTVRAASITVLWALAFTAACLPFAIRDLTVMTYDSHVFVRYAGMLRDSHGLPLVGIDFDTRGIFQIVGHAFSLFTGDDFLTTLTPAFSLSLAATFALALDRALSHDRALSPRLRRIAIAVALLVLLAIPMVRLHAVFLHTNWASAGYWCVFAALLYLAESEDDPRYLPIALLALLAYALNRVENPLFAAVFLGLAVAATRFDRRTLCAPLVAFAVPLIGWLCLLAAVVPGDSLHLDPAKALLMIAALVAVASGCFVRELASVRRLLPYALPAIAIVIALGVIVLVALRFDAFVVSFGNWQTDLWARPYWGYFTWPLLALVTVGSLWIAHPPHARVVRYMIGLFVLLVILLAALAPAGYYGSGRYADLNRISIHVVPLLWFYLALAWIPQLGRFRRA